MLLYFLQDTIRSFKEKPLKQLVGLATNPKSQYLKSWDSESIINCLRNEMIKVETFDPQVVPLLAPLVQR